MHALIVLCSRVCVPVCVCVCARAWVRVCCVRTCARGLYGMHCAESIRCTARYVRTCARGLYEMHCAHVRARYVNDVLSSL